MLVLRRPAWFGVVGGFSLLIGLTTTSSIAPQASRFDTHVRPILKRYCSECHAGKNARASLDLLALDTEAKARVRPEVWRKVEERLRTGTMPPPGVPKPSGAEQARMLEWIQTLQPPAAKRVTLRRLNRAEYANTVRDLLGVDFDPTEDFPSDDVGYGFDNIGDVLSMSALHMEKYLDAAEAIAERAIEVPKVRKQRVEAEALPYPEGGAGEEGGARVLYARATLTGTVELPEDGEYDVRVRAYQHPAGPEAARLQIVIDGREILAPEVKARRNQPATYEARVRLPKGSRRFALTFANDYYNPSDPDPKNRDRNLGLDWIEFEGPVGTVQHLPASHTRLLGHASPGQSPRDWARDILSRLALRAYRRPPSAEEVDRVMRAYDLAAREGEGFERGLQFGVTAILVSPRFLFRLEPGPGLDAYALASRLSYFLWSTTPDEELLEVAAHGSLRRPEVLKAQAMRLLKSPRSRALADNFAAQWLNLRKLAIVAPDPERYGKVDDALKADMAEETLRFFDSVVRDGRAATDLIAGRFTFLNERLARYYGIEDVRGAEFRKIALKDPNRSGVITQASVLTVTSNPTRTSPVKRGKWILDNMLGDPPPPPPPGVGDLKDDGKAVEGVTLRQRLESHRRNPSCASCHARMDPLGFALENFDGVGRWRTKDAGVAIDSVGKLPDGTIIRGPAALRNVLISRRGQFLRNLAEKLLTYSLGRGVGPQDKPAIERIVQSTSAGNDRLSTMILAIVASDPFCKGTTP